jgi:hypothetical protein
VVCDLKVTKVDPRGVTRKWTCQVESFRGGAGTEVPVKVSDHAADAGLGDYAADAGLQRVHDVPPDPPGRPRYRDPGHSVSPEVLFRYRSDGVRRENVTSVGP